MDTVLLTLIITGIGTMLNLWLVNRKDKHTTEGDFRDDLIATINRQDLKIDHQQKTIDHQQKTIDHQQATITELTAKVDKILEQLGKTDKLLEQSRKEVDNWEESYYLAIKEYNRVKVQHEDMVKELEELRKNYEQLLRDYTILRESTSMDRRKDKA